MGFSTPPKFGTPEWDRWYAARLLFNRVASSAMMLAAGLLLIVGFELACDPRSRGAEPLRLDCERTIASGSASEIDHCIGDAVECFVTGSGGISCSWVSP